MKQTQMWTYICVIFLTLQSQCSACRWLDRYGTVSAESLTLLREMSGQYHENVWVDFPGTLYNLTEKAEVEDQVRFFVLTLDHIINLMDDSEHMNSAQWNLTKVKYFLEVLQRQSSELKECVVQYQKPLKKESYEIGIKRHFRTLKKILKKEKYSAHAWEQIRRAVRSHLQRMEIIANNTKKRF
ncbi:interferon a3 isoform X1 [Carassius auratus]|uniref:Interferon a3 isoform X1 n=3 Tax=Carassius TaxID=7956 RepID=A0A6P6JUH4_CARAU|nr:interferon a3-like isoform X1 [Carassius auratus]QBB64263.1 interferon protein IFNa [Carassius gibelio]